MDSIISEAITEICSCGINGLILTDLWPTLHKRHHASLTETIKPIIWTRLLNTPGVLFQVGDKSFGVSDNLIQSYKDAEMKGVKLVAADHMRDSYLGLYDVEAEGISPQRDILKAIGETRTKGVTQSELAERFNMKGNRIFNPIKNLECRGLIRRQPMIVKTRKEYGEKSAHVLSTNLIHLSRYSKIVSLGQRLEITKSVTSKDKSTKDVVVKDYLPELKSVCDILEGAERNVKSVKNIKQILGYKLVRDQRRWTFILGKLKDAGLVEELDVIISKKVIPHLHLNKDFDEKSFMPKYTGCGYIDVDVDIDARNPAFTCDRGQIGEQILELPIEYQAYDIIDAAGPKGIPVFEVCKRLGISNKRNESRLRDMFKKYKMPLVDDMENKTKIKRVWTSRNFNNSSILPCDSEDICIKDGLSRPCEMAIHVLESSSPMLVDSLTSQDVEYDTRPTKVGMQSSFPEETVVQGGKAITSENENFIAPETYRSPIEIPPTALVEPSMPHSVIDCSCEYLNIARTKRKRRILQLLQEEPFILATELYRRFRKLEKNKGVKTKTDRKTLNSTLNIMQLEGHFKCTKVTVPGTISWSTKRTVDVVVHKSIHGIPAKYLDLIENRRKDSVKCGSESRRRKLHVKTRAAKSVRTEGVTPGTKCHIKETGEECRASEAAKQKKCAFPWLKATRQSRYPWTDSSLKLLVIQYARQRAILGPKFNRTCWVSVPDLPAPPKTCRRRMTLLRSHPSVRKAVSRLCNLLSERYNRHLRQSQEEKKLNVNDSEGIFQELTQMEGTYKSFSSIVRNIINSEEQRWDDFNDKYVKRSLDEVFQCKEMAKLKSLPRATLVNEKKSQDVAKLTRQCGRKRRSISHYHLSRKFLKRLDGDVSLNRHAHKSLAVANAMEILKLVYLSSLVPSTAPNLVEYTLQHYSEDEILTAFNHLKEENIIVTGKNKSFALSGQFIDSILSFPFAANTEERAVKFASWLKEKEKNLMEQELILNSDVQCGDIFHLLGLVSSGELSISPSLLEGATLDNEARSKFESNKDYISHRKKGFPGIDVLISSAYIPSTVEILPVEKNALLFEENEQSKSTIAATSFGNIVSAAVTDNSSPLANYSCAAVKDNNSPWIAMASYYEQYLLKSANQEMSGPIQPEFFETVCHFIRKAGDEGMSMDEVNNIAVMERESTVEYIVDILLVFGLVIKVNGYDNVHVVDVSIRPKYFLARQDLIPELVKANNAHDPDGQEEYYTNGDMFEGISLKGDSESQMSNGRIIGISPSFSPIVPWLNVDGTTNQVVYKGLIHRALRFVMQNPGISEEGVIYRMNMLSPQNCKYLLKMMVLDNHLVVKKMYQTISNSPPLLLGTLFGRRFESSQSLYREHYFANPLSTSMM